MTYYIYIYIYKYISGSPYYVCTVISTIYCKVDLTQYMILSPPKIR